MNVRLYMLVVACALAAPDGAQGQTPTCQFRGTLDALAERPSPLDSVRIPLGGAEAKLCYGRPSTDGRAMVGGEYPLDSPWPMGANEPTTLHLPFPASVGTVDVPPGSYSLYAIPGSDAWTIVVNGNPDRWSEPIGADVRAADIGSFAVTPETSPHTERLTFTFESSGPGAGSLVYAWESTSVAIPLRRR